MHLFDKHGSDHRRRSPKKIFNLPDLYRIGDDNYSLERAFSKEERAFCDVRRRLEATENIGTDDLCILYGFVASLMARPVHQIERRKEFFQRLVDVADGVTINPGAKPIPNIGGQGPTVTLAEVKRFAEDPMGTWFAPTIVGNYETLTQHFGCDVLVNQSPSPLLSSDNPVCLWWSEPGNSIYPPGLLTPGCELTIAISPRTALLFRQKEPGLWDFLSARERDVATLNSRTVLRARKTIVADRADLKFAEPIFSMLKRRMHEIDGATG